MRKNCTYQILFQFGRAFREINLHKRYVVFWWYRLALNLCGLVFRKAAPIVGNSHATRTVRIKPCTSLPSCAIQKRFWSIKRSCRNVFYSDVHDTITFRYSNLLLPYRVWLLLCIIIISHSLSSTARSTWNPATSHAEMLIFEAFTFTPHAPQSIPSRERMSNRFSHERQRGFQGSAGMLLYDHEEHTPNDILIDWGVDVTKYLHNTKTVGRLPYTDASFKIQFLQALTNVKAFWCTSSSPKISDSSFIT